MSDAHAVSRDQLRAFIERIERLEEEKKTIADDIKDVYGEAKGTGFDTKVLRKLISIRKQDRDERAEQEAILDMYMIALGMVDEPAGYDEPRQSEPVERQPAVALRSDAGLNIITKHTEITASPETATECAAPEKDAAEGERSVEADGGAALVRTLSDQPREGGNNAQQVLQHVVSDRRRHSQSDKNTEKPQAADQAGGEHEVATDNDIPAVVPTYVTGEGAANTALPAKPKVSFRPNCQHPENCASGTRDHCWSCRRAMQKSEEAA